MMSLDILTAAVVLMVIVLTAALVPLAVQLRRTLARAERLLGRLEEELPEAVRKLGEGGAEVGRLAAGLRDRVDELEAASAGVREAGRRLADTGGMIQRAVAPWAAQAAGLGAGLRAFVEFFSSRRSRRKGEDSGESTEPTPS